MPNEERERLMTLQQLRYAVCIAEKKSMNKAAGALYISQPTLSKAILDLEEEIGISLFLRSNRGVVITSDGEEFLGYARQMIEQYRMIEERFVQKQKIRKKFSVSMQHYPFAVKAFMEVAKEFGMDDYAFAIHETKTYEVMENVKNQKSEIGILYVNDFNEKAMKKIFAEMELEFQELFQCGIYVYLSKEHPLAKKETINFADLKEYPCLSFEQGDSNSFYFAEALFNN